MKILCVSQRFFPSVGGAEILTKNLMDYLSNRHEITIYTTVADDIRAFWNKNADKIKSDILKNYTIKRYEFITPLDIKSDINVEKFPLATNYPGPFSPQMWKDLISQEIHYDLIFSTAFPYDHIFPAYVASKKWKIPLIIMPLIHQEFPELYLTSIRLNVLHNADAIFVVSESEKNILLNNKIDARKISLIRPPLYPDKWKNADSNRFRNSISAGTETKIILFTGSKAFVKGVIHLMESMKAVWRRRPNTLLVMIGPSTKEFEGYFSNFPSHLKKKIVDLGVVTEEIKRDAFLSCDILVLPSKSESFGLVYLEAWLCQKPVIGCNIVTTTEIINHMVDGILVEFGNVKQLSDSITYLLDNPDLCKKFGQEGRRKAELYDAQNTLSDFETKLVTVTKSFRDKKFE